VNRKIRNRKGGNLIGKGSRKRVQKPAATEGRTGQLKVRPRGGETEKRNYLYREKKEGADWGRAIFNLAGKKERSLN